MLAVPGRCVPGVNEFLLLHAQDLEVGHLADEVDMVLLENSLDVVLVVHAGDVGVSFLSFVLLTSLNG
jgi:hypothetical protein